MAIGSVTSDYLKYKINLSASYSGPPLVDVIPSQPNMSHDSTHCALYGNIEMRSDVKSRIYIHKTCLTFVGTIIATHKSGLTAKSMSI